MTNPRLLLPILVAVAFAGVAHAGELSFGGARMLAQNGSQSGAVDVTVNFTDRGRALREVAEGGDAQTTKDTRKMRGVDDVTTTDQTGQHKPVPTQPASPKPADGSASADAPHGISISPSTAMRRPSYRWQSLVPGTIK